MQELTTRTWGHLYTVGALTVQWALLRAACQRELAGTDILVELLLLAGELAVYREQLDARKWPQAVPVEV